MNALKISAYSALALLLTSSAHGQDAYRAPISDGAYSPITKDGEPRLYKSWGKAGVDRINKAVEAAVNLTANSEKCDKVFLGGYSFERSVPKKSITVFTQCANEQKFYFTEAEALQPTKAATSVSESLSDMTDPKALGACEDVAKQNVKFQSTFDASWLNSNVTRSENGISVALAFETKNALGGVLPYVAYCTIAEDKKVSLLSIKPR